jgi:hypothetical protein
MKILEKKKIELCLDGSEIVELSLDKEITKDFIFSFKSLGELEYYDSFAKPFFKITFPDSSYIKGVQSSKTMRVHMMNPSILDKISHLM